MPRVSRAARWVRIFCGWLVLHFLYSTLVWIGVWKAAARYAGAGTWRVLARTTVVLIAAGALLLVATVLSSA